MTRISEADYAAILRSQSKPVRAAKLPAPTEAQEQEAVITWARCNVGKWPELQLLFHVPNGGERPGHAARAMARQGVSPGVPDLCLPVARGQFHSLWLELKRADHSNGPSPMQTAWLERLRAEGHLAVVAYGAAEAIHAIEHYLTTK
jgi:hypothetical protein